jgi:hypothetical protein
MENVKTLNINSDKSGPSFDLPHLIVTILVVAVAAGLVIAQFSYAQDPNSQISLANLDKRADVLSQITDPVEREKLDIGLSAEGRQLDAVIPKDARVFMTGMVGHTNQPSLGYYYFFRNYLFPRDLEISLDQGHFGKGGFYGTTTDDPEVARTNGFDLMIRFDNNSLQFIPLTAKAVPNAAPSQ